jgi:hypothetical protein
MPIQKPPLDPDVADMALSAPTLAAYDQEHLVTYLRLLDADAEVRTGARSRASFCILIRIENKIARDMHLTVIWHEQNG